MKVTDERVEEIIQSMIGTCHDMDYYLEDAEELSLEQVHFISTQVAPCEVCGWNFCFEELDEYGECEHCSNV
jgi:hypothetical protein